MFTNLRIFTNLNISFLLLNYSNNKLYASPKNIKFQSTSQLLTFPKRVVVKPKSRKKKKKRKQTYKSEQYKREKRRFWREERKLRTAKASSEREKSSRFRDRIRKILFRTRKMFKEGLHGSSHTILVLHCLC